MSDTHLTITLTDAPPVRLDKAAWPLIAQSIYHDGQIEAQANRHYRLRVRRHADGRAVVYAIYTTAFSHEADKRAGIVVPANGDIAAAIRRVAESMDWETGPGSLCASCIADLPAADI
jgi:hypothetical protein